ncbi:MAG: Trk system potassium transporter TrkA [Clostridia bacterium]|nr:Trk system potassium transporter TrkA [Clostridia bacterium]
MNIIIAGCGKIGKTLVADLVSEGHDITVIDQSAQAIDDITNTYDVMGVCGNATDCDTLEEASVYNSDLFIAVTSSDELNMLACFLAKKIGAAHSVARIRNPEYNDRSLGFMRQHLDISMSINPEKLVAQELYNILRLPSAFKVEYFSRRNLEMIEVKLKAEHQICGMTLMKLRDKFKENFLISAVLRGGQVYIPDGSFVLEAGDIISIAASPNDMQKLLKGMGMLQKGAKDVILLGGSKIAYYLAKMLTSSGINVKIVEKELERCQHLSDNLPKTVIIHGDGSHQDLLLEEGIRNVDACVSLTGMDEENIIISIFASSHNVPKVITKINSDELCKMSERLGLDCVVSPKSITSDVIVRYARALQNSQGSNVETMYKIMDGKAEVLEFKVGSDARLTDVPLKNLKIKPGTLIVGIIRAGKVVIIPTGDDVIKNGDKVIVLAADHRLDDLSHIVY